MARFEFQYVCSFSFFFMTSIEKCFASYFEAGQLFYVGHIKDPIALLLSFVFLEIFSERKYVVHTIDYSY